VGLVEVEELYHKKCLVPQIYHQQLDYMLGLVELQEQQEYQVLSVVMEVPERILHLVQVQQFI
jgi:hypothetical protein